MNVIRSECNRPVFCLYFFPQMAIDKNNGGTLANMQGNLVSVMSQNHCIYFVFFYATEVYYVQLFQI